MKRRTLRACLVRNLRLQTAPDEFVRVEGRSTSSSGSKRDTTRCWNFQLAECGSFQIAALVSAKQRAIPNTMCLEPCFVLIFAQLLFCENQQGSKSPSQRSFSPFGLNQLPGT